MANLAVVFVATEVVGEAVDVTELITPPVSPADLLGDVAAAGTLVLPPGVEPPARYFNRMNNIIIRPKTTKYAKQRYLKILASF